MFSCSLVARKSTLPPALFLGVRLLCYSYIVGGGGGFCVARGRDSEGEEEEKLLLVLSNESCFENPGDGETVVCVLARSGWPLPWRPSSPISFSKCSFCSVLSRDPLRCGAKGNFIWRRSRLILLPLPLHVGNLGANFAGFGAATIP